MLCKDGYLLEDKECLLKDISKRLIYENSINYLLCEDCYAVDNIDSVEIPELTNYAKYDINLSPFRYTKYHSLFYLDPVGNKCLPVDEKTSLRIVMNIVKVNNV